MSDVTYGVSVVIVQDLPLDDGLGKIAAAGFTQVELVCNGRTFTNWWLDPEPLARALEVHGLRVRSVHSPYEGWNNDALDDPERKRSVDLTSAVLAPAATLGAEVVILHPNIPSAPMAGPAYDAAFARSVESLRILAERAGEAGVRVALENMPILDVARPGGSVVEALRMIDGLGDHVGIWVDAGHANANGIDPVAEVRAAGDRLFGVHIQDNDGCGRDQHLIPGTGTITWSAFLAAVDEVAPDAVRSFEIPAGEDGVEGRLHALGELRRRWTSPHPFSAGGG